MPYTIAQAATLIADFDPALARHYVASPFHRRTIAEVFEQQILPIVGFELAARIAAVLLMAHEVDMARLSNDSVEG
ncbi:MAG: hypothetical protein RJA36_3087 [Pseudomonadota bacterium]